MNILKVRLECIFYTDDVMTLRGGNLAVPTHPCNSAEEVVTGLFELKTVFWVFQLRNFSVLKSAH